MGFLICFWVVHSGGGFYQFCSQLVVDFDPMVGVVGFLGFVGRGGDVFFFHSNGDGFSGLC